MVDLSIITTDPVVPDPLVLPSQAMLDTLLAEPASESLYSFLPGPREDAVSWSPDMWWLLNWWTSLFPPPCNTGGEGAIYGIDRVLAEHPGAHGQQSTPLGPALAAAEQGVENSPGPPRFNDVIQRTVNYGNGLIDLFA